ncbi:hypothetical protein [Winogradskyella sp. PG-2]|uniref:hypothetical protein n=1 Tax=Winogradskyella sp. PG-2 TaxID=754409 RepID=UPI0004587087|nr:hypothetical protein [Winogradskyella sp. PG-2]BAO74438.1 hypothetical protein WPG_0208 [Winogradskyella sp. PG-2]
MAQDLRNLFGEDPKNSDIKMSEGHDARFLQKLNEEFPKKKSNNRFSFLNIAASVIVLLGLSYGAFQFFQKPPVIPTEVVENNDVIESKDDIKSLGEVVPDLQKVEDYYLASINLELSKVELTLENKELVDGYILRLKELNEEYDKLTIELNENGPNEATLDALIDNLKFRLNLVMRLKEKLQEFNDDSFSEAHI